MDRGRPRILSQGTLQLIAKMQVHHLGSWSLNGALAKFDDDSDDGDDNEKDGADDDDAVPKEAQRGSEKHQKTDKTGRERPRGAQRGSEELRG